MREEKMDCRAERMNKGYRREECVCVLQSITGEVR